MGAVSTLCQQRNKVPGSPVSTLTGSQALVLQNCFLEGASVGLCLGREALQVQGQNLLDEYKAVSSQFGKRFCLLPFLKTRKEEVQDMLLLSSLNSHNFFLFLTFASHSYCLSCYSVEKSYQRCYNYLEVKSDTVMLLLFHLNYTERN